MVIRSWAAWAAVAPPVSARRHCTIYSAITDVHRVLVTNIFAVWELGLLRHDEGVTFNRATCEAAAWIARKCAALAYDDQKEFAQAS